MVRLFCRGRRGSILSFARGRPEFTAYRTVPERQAESARRDPFFSPRRLLRDDVRGCRGWRARARYPAYLALQRRRAALRSAVPFSRAVYRKTAQGRTEGCYMRADAAGEPASPIANAPHARCGRAL